MFHANCSTKGVIYLMVCASNAFYVGKTIRELYQRIGDHLYCSTNGKFTTVGQHIGLHHIFDPEVVKLWCLKRSHRMFVEENGAIGFFSEKLSGLNV